MTPELQGIVDEASQVLDAPITLEDVDFNLVAYGSQGEDVDSVRQQSILRRQSSHETRQWFEQFGIATSAEPVRTPADEVRAVRARLCLPARWRGVTYGYLWAYDWAAARPALDDEVVRRGMDLAEHAAMFLARRDRQQDAAATALTDLLSVDPEDVWRGFSSAQEQGRVVRGGPFAVLVVGTCEPIDELSLNHWRLPRTLLNATRGAGATALVTLARADDLTPASDIAMQVIALYAERLPAALHPALVAGIGGARTSPQDARDSLREAQLALRVATAVEEQRPIAAWDELGAYRLLAANPERRLLQGDAVQRALADPELAHTARVFLDQAGNVAAAARELGIHRQTLYYRLGRVEELSGLSFKSGRDRLVLHLSLVLDPLL